MAPLVLLCHPMRRVASPSVAEHKQRLTVDLVDSDRDALYEIENLTGGAATDVMRAMIRYFGLHPKAIPELATIMTAAINANKEALRRTRRHQRIQMRAKRALESPVASEAEYVDENPPATPIKRAAKKRST